MTNKKLNDTLAELGISGRFTGKKYIEDAMAVMEPGEEVYGTLTKKIYPEIGKKHGKSAESVEHAIRTALGFAWKRGNPATIDAVFGGTVNISKGRPTNGEFLICLYEYIEE